MKYAVGEIFLVVIGILIALQVNDWNENRKAAYRLNNLLAALRSEFETNLVQLDSVLLFDNRVVKSSFRALHLRADDPLLQNRDSMRQLIQHTSWTWTFDPLNGALRSGIASGDIGLIRSERLKNLLFNWQDVVADARENELWALQLRQNNPSITRHIRNADYRSSHLPELGPSKFPSDYGALIDDPEFEDYISDRYSKMKDALIELNQVREQNVAILELIRQEQQEE